MCDIINVSYASSSYETLEYIMFKLTLILNFKLS
jgi:hypothetical protein